VAKAGNLDGVELYRGWVSDTEVYSEPDPTEGTVAAGNAHAVATMRLGLRPMRVGLFQ
jgi:hypothetical protein